MFTETLINSSSRLQRKKILNLSNAIQLIFGIVPNINFKINPQFKHAMYSTLIKFRREEIISLNKTNHTTQV